MIHVSWQEYLDVRDCFVVFLGGEERVEVVGVEQVITVGDQVEELVEGVRPLRDDFGLEVSDQDFFGKEKVAEDGGVKRLEDALVDEAEVRVPSLNHRRVRLCRSVAASS